MTVGARATDTYGNELSTRSTDAAEHFNQALDMQLSGNPGAMEALDAAIAADEGFAVAHIDPARLLQFGGKIPEARAAAERARELAPGTSVWEQSHIETLAVAVEGKPADAIARAREHLAEHPRDPLVVTAASGLIFFGGSPTRAEERLQLTEQVAPSYGDDDWWFLSAHAFSLHEVFRIEESREKVTRSLALRRDNYAGAHSMAHVQIESEEMEEGASFLGGWLPEHDRRGGLYSHIAWHLALFELFQGNEQRALELYESEIRPGKAERPAALIILADSASLLWRCEMFGEREIGTDRASWEALGDFSTEAFPPVGASFADLHRVLAYAAAGDADSLGTLIDGLKTAQREGRLPAGEVVPVLAEAIAAFAAEDYDGAVRLLQPFEDEIGRVGGSHAQWQVFEDTLLEAYLRSGGVDMAASLLRKRIDRQPTDRDRLLLTRALAGTEEFS
jgi:tetratricopeptide (TPR) repeat protein